MDDIGKWNSYIQAQLPCVRPTDKELILTLTIPLEADQREFRVGWDLKRPGGRGWVAITTGRAVWDRFDLSPAAAHILALLDETNRMLEAHRDDR